MFEYGPDQQPIHESSRLIFDVEALLHDSLSLVQGAPEGRDKFKSAHPLIQNFYQDGLEKIEDMQSLLGVTELVDNPIEIAGRQYSRRDVVGCALQTIAASPILDTPDKQTFLYTWIALAAGPKRSYRTQARAKIAAIESLRDLHELHQIPDAKILASGLEVELRFTNGHKVAKLCKHLGTMLVHKKDK